MNLKKKLWFTQRSVERCTAEKWKRKPKNKHNKFWLFVVRKQIIRLNSNYTQYAENSNRIRVNGAQWVLFTVHCSHMCPFINIFVSTGECVAVCVFCSFLSYASLEIQFLFNLLLHVVYFVSINYHKTNLP